MQKFIELIRDMHDECYNKVLNKLVTQKIPIAMLSVVDINKSFDMAKKFASQLNLTHLITLSEDVPDTMTDFKIVSVHDAIKQHLRHEYILALSDIDARFASRNFPESKVIWPQRDKTAEIYDIFMSNLPALKDFYDSLIDEESRKTFRGYWLGNVANRLDKIHHSNNSHYMTPGFIPERGAIVIDGGSYDGGTCLRFVERGFKVYGFEPDKNIFDLAAQVAKKNHFVVENVGLGSYKHMANYIPQVGGSTHLDENGSETAQIITRDEYVREKNLPRVDFIKLDVEGSELDALRGAVTTIACFKPILAICVYHKWDDFWTLMNFVKALNPTYEFALRQYHVSIEDEPFVFDENFQQQLALWGLEPYYKNYNECVLLAR